MRIHIKNKEELRERLRVYRPMALYMSGDPLPLQFCRCAPIFIHYDQEGSFVICWYEDGHLVEAFLPSDISLDLKNCIVYGPGKYMWSDKYMLDEIVEKYILFVDTH